MTRNDLFVNERCLLIRKHADELAKLMREGRDLPLFVAIYNINKLSGEAMDSLAQSLDSE